METRKISGVFGKPVQVINVGLESMAESLKQQGVSVIQLDWKPSPENVPYLHSTRSGVDIDQANQVAISRIMQASPILIGMGLAKDVIPGYHDRLILHAGPPISWDRMCGPLQGAVMGALIYEGIAQDEKQANDIAASNMIEYAPCHHYHAVGPMAGVVSPHMPVFIIQNNAFGNKAYCTMNEGLGKVLRYGGMGPEVYSRLKWMETELYPVMDRAIQSFPDGIDIKSILAQALQMGDEGHNRNRAGTSLFLRMITAAFVSTTQDTDAIIRVIKFIDKNDHFFLNLTMPAGKASIEPAEGIEGSSIVTVMARNGTDFGIRISCMPNRWFTAPAPSVTGLYFPGFSEKDGNLDIGDSTITETAGYGGFAMAAAPAITQFVGGTAEMALQTTLEMYEITFGEHEGYKIPALSFRGTPLGIDVRRVMETGILPRINTGIAHKEPGIGGIGAGLTKAPVKCFRDAFDALKSLCP